MKPSCILSCSSIILDCDVSCFLSNGDSCRWEDPCDAAYVLCIKRWGVFIAEVNSFVCWCAAWNARQNTIIPKHVLELKDMFLHKENECNATLPSPETHFLYSIENVAKMAPKFPNGFHMACPDQVWTWISIYLIVMILYELRRRPDIPMRCIDTIIIIFDANSMVMLV